MNDYLPLPHAPVLQRTMWQAWTNGLLGLWLILASFLNMGRTDSLIYGILTGIAAAVAGWMIRRERPLQGWCAVLIAAWIAGGTLLPGLQEAAAQQWNHVISGVALAVAGFTSLGGERQSHPSAQR